MKGPGWRSDAKVDPSQLCLLPSISILLCILLALFLIPSSRFATFESKGSKRWRWWSSPRPRHRLGLPPNPPLSVLSELSSGRVGDVFEAYRSTGSEILCIPPLSLHRPSSLLLIPFSCLFWIVTIGFGWISPTYQEQGKGSSEAIIILNSERSATELLDARSGLYSDRPKAVMGNLLRSGGLSVPFTSYGPLFRKHRRAFCEAFSKLAIPRYDENVKEDLRVLLVDLVRISEEVGEGGGGGGLGWSQEVYRFVTSQTMNTVFGRRVGGELEKDRFVNLARKCNENFFQFNRPGAGFLVDRFPWLTNLPYLVNPWKRMCRPWFEKELELFRTEMKEAATSPTRRRANLARRVYETMEETGLTESQAAYLCGTMYGASVDTTFQALSVFFLASANHWEKLKEAREEVDDVVGATRPPDHSDLERLERCRALVKEVVRWRPFAHGAAPHRVMEEDEYRGMRVPKGSTVYGNVWAIHQDPLLYPDPESFQPDRYLAGNTKGIRRERFHSKRDLFSFGFGRRICPGESSSAPLTFSPFPATRIYSIPPSFPHRQLAMRTLTLTVATILWGFEIRAPLDAETGEEIKLDESAFKTDSLSR
ncbi:cytochrome P450 [Violaceomyces palustris]|uniref:Cytochrome P450 n=1 Tax=Violaceomyces palustris TaxID=1673888 RepID=A0ACD0P8D8_9BASI|nr:cytochrome P450 [Violaceomyces palustris]